MSNERLNIVIAGKSGVGKSSFLNYLVGSNVFQTGIGDAVTQAYFDNVNYRSPLNGVEYCLYDTKGIETNSADACKATILEEIRRRDEADDIFEWIHTVFYCFAASSKRIEPFEVSFIKELINNGVGVVVLLTKSDLVTPADIQSVTAQLYADLGGYNLQVIPVCSVKVETRRGVSMPSGREEVLNASFLGLWNKLSKILPLMVVNVCFLNKNWEYSDLVLYSEFKSVRLNSDFLDAITSFSRRKLGRTARIYGDESIDWDAFHTYCQNQLCYLLKETKRNHVPLHPEWLADMPTMSDFMKANHSGIWSDWMKAIHSYKKLDSWSWSDGVGAYVMMYLFHSISELFEANAKDFESASIEEIENRNCSLYDKVFDFYYKANGVRPNKIYNHASKQRLIALKNYDFKNKIGELKSIANQSDSAIDDIWECLFDDSAEKQRLFYLYDKFRRITMEIARGMTDLCNAYMASLEAEITEYGNQCIRQK